MGRLDLAAAASGFVLGWGVHEGSGLLIGGAIVCLILCAWPRLVDGKDPEP